RAGGDLPDLLAAIARTMAESLGYDAVVVNLYRPAWDDFEVTTVHGSDAARQALLGETQSAADWGQLLDERFCRHGAYVLPAGAYESAPGKEYVPTAEPGAGDDAWQPQDALFVPLRHTDGHLLGVVSVDDLDALVALADHAALAVQAALETAVAAGHRAALERLLVVSSRLPAEPVADEILAAVCSGVSEALGFHNVLAVLR